MVVDPLTVPTTKGSLADLVGRNAAEAGPETAFSVRSTSPATSSAPSSAPSSGGAVTWRPVTWAEFDEQVRAVAKGLVALGVEPGDRVGIMSRTRYEWTVLDFAAWTAGAVVVPIYETSSSEQVLWILGDAGVRTVVVETSAHRDVVDAVRGEATDLRDVLVVDDGALDRLRELGAEVGDDDLARRRKGIDRTSPATIIYTSGTTGRPKGCELTHGNFLDLTDNAIGKLGDVVLSDGAATLLFLPLAHVFARFIEVLCVSGRARMGHSADIRTLLDDFSGFQPTFVLAVPRVFEKIYNSAEAKATAEGKGRIFSRAADVAVAWSAAQDEAGPGLALRLQHAVFDRLVYGKLRAAMGGQVRYAVSGGAPLGSRLGHFYRGIGILILEGYGLTETTAPVCVNTPDRVKIGTVGPPLPGSAIRIADDGEILVRGVGVFGAYHGNEQATRDALVDGWFHSGDLGSLDGDGYLRITGRKKEILVTAGGKNVAPAVLEDRLRAHPIVSQCIVVGDQKPFIAALITLDAEMWPLWAKNHGLDGVSLDAARSHPAVQEALQEAVDHANLAVSKAESIRKFAVLDGDFTEDNGYLTPSLKLKRNVVMRDFADDVEALFA